MLKNFMLKNVAFWDIKVLLCDKKDKDFSKYEMVSLIELGQHKSGTQGNEYQSVQVEVKHYVVHLCHACTMLIMLLFCTRITNNNPISYWTDMSWQTV